MTGPVISMPLTPPDQPQKKVDAAIEETKPAENPKPPAKGLFGTVSALAAGYFGGVKKSYTGFVTGFSNKRSGIKALKWADDVLILGLTLAGAFFSAKWADKAAHPFRNQKDESIAGGVCSEANINPSILPLDDTRYVLINTQNGFEIGRRQIRNLLPPFLRNDQFEILDLESAKLAHAAVMEHLTKIQSAGSGAESTSGDSGFSLKSFHANFSAPYQGGVLNDYDYRSVIPSTAENPAPMNFAQHMELWQSAGEKLTAPDRRRASNPDSVVMDLSKTPQMNAWPYAAAVGGGVAGILGALCLIRVLGGAYATVAGVPVAIMAARQRGER